MSDVRTESNGLQPPPKIKVLSNQAAGVLHEASIKIKIIGDNLNTISESFDVLNRSDISAPSGYIMQNQSLYRKLVAQLEALQLEINNLSNTIVLY